MRTNAFRAAVIAAALLLSQGCTTTAPTIAHVHVGHAITGANNTPNKQGYFVLAESLAERGMILAQSLQSNTSSTENLRAGLQEINQLLNLQQPWALTSALREAANHITFAADSKDASANVMRGAKAFEQSIEGILFRNNLISLYAVDAQSAKSNSELATLAQEVAALAVANVQGTDANNNGTIGDSPREFGMYQLRANLDAMVAGEDPPYRTVDRWYLFNLIRLPSGDWIFNRNKGGSSRGY